MNTWLGLHYATQVRSEVILNTGQPNTHNYKVKCGPSEWRREGCND